MNSENLDKTTEKTQTTISKTQQEWCLSHYCRSCKYNEGTKCSMNPMWTKEYWDNNGGLCRHLSRNNSKEIPVDISAYEIIFEYGEQRYYCFVDAISMDEALGIFFRNHDTVNYHNIVDHVEI